MTRYTPKTKPFGHQARATIAALRHKNYALWMEPRVGKTKVAIDYCGMLALKQSSLPLRVVVLYYPLIALDVWLAQLKRHAPYIYSWETPEEILERPDASVKYFLVNYEKIAQRRKKKSSGYTHPYVEEIEAFDPDVIICDESHKLKRAGGVTAQAAWRMVRRLREERQAKDGKPYVLLMSGTPNPKGWIDLFAQYRVMDDTIFGTNKGWFEEDYCVYGKGNRKWTIVKYKDEKKLLKKVRDHSITVTASQAGLAGRQFVQTLRVDLPAPIRVAYNELADELITEVNEHEISATNAGVKRLRLLQIAGGFTTDGSCIHDAGLRAAKGYLELLKDQGEQAVVYARFLPEVHALGALATRVGLRSETLVGATSRGTRTEAIDAFQRKQLDCLVFQNQVGSLAIELSSAAEVFFYSLPDSWDNYYQARQRVMGPNQHRPVRITHLLVRGTVSMSVLRGLIRKEDWHVTLYDSPERYLYGESLT